MSVRVLPSNVQRHFLFNNTYDFFNYLSSTFNIKKYSTALMDFITLTKTVLILLKKTVVKIVVRTFNVMMDMFTIQTNTHLQINVWLNVVFQLVKYTSVLLDTI